MGPPLWRAEGQRLETRQFPPARLLGGQWTVLSWGAPVSSLQGSVTTRSAGAHFTEAETEAQAAPSPQCPSLSLRPCSSSFWEPPTAPWPCSPAKRRSTRWGPSAAPSASQVGAALQGPSVGDARARVVGRGRNYSHFPGPQPLYSWDPHHGRPGAPGSQKGSPLQLSLPTLLTVQGSWAGGRNPLWPETGSQEAPHSSRKFSFPPKMAHCGPEKSQSLWGFSRLPGLPRGAPF